MTQLALAAFSLLAIAGFTSGYPPFVRLASIAGLCSQPFWLYATFTASQWGMFTLSIVYTNLYAWAIVRDYYLHPRNRHLS